MEHRFEIYYSEAIHELGQLVLQFNKAKIPLNRTGIFVDEKSEKVLTLNVDPFEKKYSGLQISYQFNNRERKYNQLQPTEIEGLEFEYKYQQKCFLTFQGIDKPKLSTEQLYLIEWMADVLKTKRSQNNLIIYDNGHFKFLVKLQTLLEQKENLINLIIEWNR